MSAGRLHALHRGVFAVGHRLLSARGRLMAACLACGDRALISHADAAYLWGIAAHRLREVHVTTPERGRASQPGITLHRVRSLHPRDLAERDRIPVTSLARTLLDLAETWSTQHVERAVEEADRLGLLEMKEVRRVCERSRGRVGLRVLREVLENHHYEPAETRSELERRFLAFCGEAGLPAPAVNVPVEGFEVDALWRDAWLVVELDSYAFHRTRAAFERDHVRDAVLKAAGYEVLRVTHRMLEHQRPSLERTIRSLLSAPRGLRRA